MKRICEIYDVSKDYEMPTGTVLIIVSDIEKDKIISILLNTKLKEDMVFNNTEWQEYLEINNKYKRNEAKHQMREIRQSKRLESDVSHIYEIDIGESLENEEIEMYLKKFMLNLKPVQRRRFKMYFIDNLTYRQIADIESRNIKSIYESVQAGKKEIFKIFGQTPQQKYPNKFKFMKGHPFVQLNTHSSDTFLLLCKA
jgi:mannose/fructose/N-acetylgalactosamine-specific phosphotransferase system component IIB